MIKLTMNNYCYYCLNWLEKVIYILNKANVDNIKQLKVNRNNFNVIKKFD